MAKKQTIFQIEEVIAERLKSLSSSTGVSMVKIVEKALLLFMEQIEQGNNTLLFASNEAMPSTVDLKTTSNPTIDSGSLNEIESKVDALECKVLNFFVNQESKTDLEEMLDRLSRLEKELEGDS